MPARNRLMRKALNLYVRVMHPRFYELKQKTHGMLNPLVYRRMYQVARRLPDLDVVEIGGAAGAGSVALALGMKESGKRSKLIVVEKLEGGSRERYGGYQENLAILRNSFRSFDVEEQVTLYGHELTFENGSEVVSLVSGAEIAAFIHDADGRLDRDFFLFWPLLRAGGMIIVDDYVDRLTYQPVSRQHPQGGMKSVMTYRLLNQLIAWGLFRRSSILGNTVFGYKPPGADFARFDLEVCHQIIEGVQQERDAYLRRTGQPLTTAH